VARVLKPGGVFLCYTTDFNLLKQVLIAIFFWDRYFDPQSPHIRFLKRSTFRSLEEQCGLEEVAYRWHRSYLGIMPQGMCHVARKPA
jgi:ubiquinone/menaquinone biosynthesis C-methylase UbiE